MQVLNDFGDDWQSLLYRTFKDDENNTPFREMIRKMPGVFIMYV